MEEKLKKDNAIMRILKTKELRYNIGLTKERATIELVINKEDSKYQFYVDSMALPEIENDAMLKIFNLK